MAFTDEQKSALSAPLSRDNVKTRSQSGRNLSYIEGWVAIKEANRIFGFDGWSRETVDLRCVVEAPRKVGRDQAEGWGVTYTAKVRILVGSGADLIVREGSGTGHGIDRDQGQAHESALKEAETDAMKRALMTFGNPFGLALYDKEQAEVENAPRNPSKPSEKSHEDGHDGQVQAWCDKEAAKWEGFTRIAELEMWKDEREAELKRLQAKSPKMHDYLMQQFKQKQEQLGGVA